MAVIASALQPECCIGQTSLQRRKLFFLEHKLTTANGYLFAVSLTIVSTQRHFQRRRPVDRPSIYLRNYRSALLWRCGGIISVSESEWLTFDISVPLQIFRALLMDSWTAGGSTRKAQAVTVQ